VKPGRRAAPPGLTGGVSAAWSGGPFAGLVSGLFSGLFSGWSAVLFTTVVASVLLGGCATAPTESDTSPPPQAVDAGPPLTEAERWALHRDAVTALDHWQARGKVAYRLPDDAGSAGLLWEQAGAQSEVRVSGPLGVGSTLIRNDGPLIRVRRDGIDRLYPADAAPWLPDGQLLPIPIGSLHYWLRGVPDPALPVARLEYRDGRASAITQAGWSIDIEQYEELRAPALPQRLVIRSDAGELSLTVLLRQWELQGPAGTST
jgi:outer membrane lipoprotein LolB